MKKFKFKFIRLVIKFWKSYRRIVYWVISDNKPLGNPICEQPLLSCGKGAIEFQGKVSLGVRSSPYFFSTHIYMEARNETAKIIIKNGTMINNGFSVIAEHSSVEIGENCLIGYYVEIVDSNFHGVKIEERHSSHHESARPVIIESDVFIGSNVKIMKGVRISHGSVIANGSVVVKDIPPLVIAGGNPARVIRSI